MMVSDRRIVSLIHWSQAVLNFERHWSDTAGKDSYRQSGAFLERPITFAVAYMWLLLLFTQVSFSAASVISKHKDKPSQNTYWHTVVTSRLHLTCTRFPLPLCAIFDRNTSSSHELKRNSAFLVITRGFVWYWSITPSEGKRYLPFLATWHRVTDISGNQQELQSAPLQEHFILIDFILLASVETSWIDEKRSPQIINIRTVYAYSHENGMFHVWGR